MKKAMRIFSKRLGNSEMILYAKGDEGHSSCKRRRGYLQKVSKGKSVFSRAKGRGKFTKGKLI